MHMAADHRTDGRRKSHDHAVHGENADAALVVVEVTNDGQSNDRLGGRGDALQHPRNDQHVDRHGKGAHQAADQKAEHPEQKHGPPAEAVRQRAVKQLSHGETEDVEAERELDRCRIGTEVGWQVRQARRVEVGGEDAGGARRDQHGRDYPRDAIGSADLRHDGP